MNAFGDLISSDGRISLPGYIPSGLVSKLVSHTSSQQKAQILSANVNQVPTVDEEIWSFKHNTDLLTTLKVKTTFVILPPKTTEMEANKQTPPQRLETPISLRVLNSVRSEQKEGGEGVNSGLYFQVTSRNTSPNIHALLYSSFPCLIHGFAFRAFNDLWPNMV